MLAQPFLQIRDAPQAPPRRDSARRWIAPPMPRAFAVRSRGEPVSLASGSAARQTDRMAIFFYRHGRNLFGPMKGSDLKRLAKMGKVLPEGEVKKGADGQWKPASNFGDLFTGPMVVQPVPEVVPPENDLDEVFGDSDSDPELAPVESAAEAPPVIVDSPVATRKPARRGVPLAACLVAVVASLATGYYFGAQGIKLQIEPGTVARVVWDDSIERDLESKRVTDDLKARIAELVREAETKNSEVEAAIAKYARLAKETRRAEEKYEETANLYAELGRLNIGEADELKRIANKVKGGGQLDEYELQFAFDKGGAPARRWVREQWRKRGEAVFGRDDLKALEGER